LKIIKCKFDEYCAVLLDLLIFSQQFHLLVMLWVIRSKRVDAVGSSAKILLVLRRGSVLYLLIRIIICEMASILGVPVISKRALT